MSLRSGLLGESTWAIDTLNIMTFDDSTVVYFGLAHLPGLVDVLLDHFKRQVKLSSYQRLGFRGQSYPIVISIVLQKTFLAYVGSLTFQYLLEMNKAGYTAVDASGSAISLIPAAQLCSCACACARVSVSVHACVSAPLCIHRAGRKL